jgi:V8-like Glu-specific endopeptidase
VRVRFGQLDGGLHPQAGALVVELRDPPQLAPFCSGTLISPTVFLTAAHCFQAFDAFGIEQFSVTFSNKVDASATLLTGTSHVATGANSGGLTDTLDLAVVLLDDAVTSVTPAQLPTLGLLNETAEGATLSRRENGPRPPRPDRRTAARRSDARAARVRS